MKRIYNRKERRFIRCIKSRILKNYPGRLDKDFLLHIRNVFTCLDLPRDVTGILELCNEKKIDFLNLFKNRKPYFSCDLSFESLLENPQSFIFITDFGGINRNTYLHKSCSYLFLSSRISRKANTPLANNLFDHYPQEREDHDVPFKMRSYQLLCVYLHYKYSPDHASSDYEIALKVLWSSIPDPFLTYAEYTTTFKWIDKRYAPILQTAWSWYCALIKGPDGDSKCPRSLKHLSRCTVRDSLKSCFQLPYGVEKLPFPKSVKQYLLLKDFETELKCLRQIKDMDEYLENFRRTVL